MLKTLLVLHIYKAPVFKFPSSLRHVMKISDKNFNTFYFFQLTVSISPAKN